MRSRAEKSQGVLADLIPETLCNINTNYYDRLKALATTLTANFVEVTQGGVYLLACKDSVLNWCFNRSNIVKLPETTVEQVGLSKVLNSGKQLKTIFCGLQRR